MSITLSYGTPTVADQTTLYLYANTWIPDWSLVPDTMVTLTVTFTAEGTGAADGPDQVAIYLGGPDVGAPGDPTDYDLNDADTRGARVGFIDIPDLASAEYTAAFTIPNPRGSVVVRAVLLAYETPGHSVTLDTIDIVIDNAGDVMTLDGVAWAGTGNVSGTGGTAWTHWTPDFSGIAGGQVAVDVAMNAGYEGEPDRGTWHSTHGGSLIDPPVNDLVRLSVGGAGPGDGDTVIGELAIPVAGPADYSAGFTVANPGSLSPLWLTLVSQPSEDILGELDDRSTSLFSVAITLSGGDCRLLTSTDDLDLSGDDGNVSLYLRSFDVDLTPFAGVAQLALTLVSQGEAVSSGTDTDSLFLRVMATIGGADAGALNDVVADPGDTLLFVHIPQLDVTPQTATAIIANPGGTVTIRLWGRSMFGHEVGTPTALIHGATLEICAVAAAAPDLAAPPSGLPPVDPILDELLGTDIDVAFDLPRSFVLASGLKNLGNAIVRRLSTPAGALAAFGDDPDYGYDLRGKLNASMPLGRIQTIGAEVEAEILKDERIDAADVAVSFDLAASVLRVEIAMATAVGPYRLVLAVTDRTIDIINA